MSLLIDNGNNNYTINLNQSTYKSYLSNGKLELTIDMKNIHCNTCDDIFEKVFDFVDKNYKETTTEDIELSKEFYESYTYTSANTNKLLNILKEKAKDALKNKMNEKMADEETKHTDTSFLTALQEKAKDALKTQMNKHLEPEKKNNKCVESDSQENDENLLDNNTVLTLTIKDYNNNNKVTPMKLTVQQIIDALNKKIPNTNTNKEYNKLMKTKKTELINALINALNNNKTVGDAVKILKNKDYNVDPKQKNYNQCYNEFIYSLYSNHPFHGGNRE